MQTNGGGLTLSPQLDWSNEYVLVSLQVPGDPKMVVAPLQAKELATFSLTSLERAPVRHLSLQPDLGIPLSYLDMGVYAVPDRPQPLAPEDAALVEVRTPT